MTVRRLSFDRNGTEDTKLGESVADTLLKSDEASRKRSCIFPIEFWQIDNLQEKISQRLRADSGLSPPCNAMTVTTGSEVEGLS